MRYRFLRYPDFKCKAVTLSYDDGVRQDIKFIEKIEKHGFKCTFNINTGFIGKVEGEGRLTYSEIKANILDKGHEVAIHGNLHCAPGICSPIKTTRDVLDCRLQLEKEFGIIIRGMAYPDSGIKNFQNGADYDTVRQILKNLGVTYSRSLNGDNNTFKLPNDWYNWLPTCHHNNPNTLEWAKSFAELDVSSLYYSSQFPRLFYLWGHTYEFDNNKNWERIDEIGEILGNNDDIWYATNSEVCEYVKAYESLIFSADETMVYNPTVKTIWFEVDSKQFVIKAGETLKLDIA